MERREFDIVSEPSNTENSSCIEIVINQEEPAKSQVEKSTDQEIPPKTPATKSLESDTKANEAKDCPLDSSIQSQTEKEFRFQWNRCKIYCPMCTSVHNSIQTYREHSEYAHKLKPAENLYKSVSVIPKHECFLCGVSIVFERLTVASHIRSKHRMPMKNYERRFSSKLKALFKNNMLHDHLESKFQWNQCKLYCYFCENLFNNIDAYRMHI